MPGPLDPRLVPLDRYLHATGATVACTLLVGGLLVVRWNLASERSSIDSEITSARQILNEEAAIRAEHTLLTSRLANLKKRSSELTARIPESPREAEFLAQLSDLAGHSRLAIHSYRPGRPVASERCQRLDVEVAAAGSFDSLCRFLEGLESLPRLCRLDRLDVESAAAGDGVYPVTMTLRIFFAPKQSATSTAAARSPAA